MAISSAFERTLIYLRPIVSYCIQKSFEFLLNKHTQSFKSFDTLEKSAISLFLIACLHPYLACFIKL